ncbi:MAG TPA: hypothetical protein VD978_19905 [Azospirillum sp.]|nr:hypothetical protein [Azospirillum sp.]
MAALLLGAPVTALAEEPAVEEQIVDAMQAAFGKHPGQRANHAKGIVVEGTFQPAPDAASITRAAHFQSTTVPVVVRFPMQRAYPASPTAIPRPILMEWLSSSTCRTAATPTW